VFVLGAMSYVWFVEPMAKVRRRLHKLTHTVAFTFLRKQ
jgi:hypothetical protein